MSERPNVRDWIAANPQPVVSPERDACGEAVVAIHRVFLWPDVPGDVLELCEAMLDTLTACRGVLDAVERHREAEARPDLGAALYAMGANLNTVLADVAGRAA